MNNTEFEETLTSLLRKGAVRMVRIDGIETIEITDKGIAACDPCATLRK